MASKYTRSSKKIPLENGEGFKTDDEKVKDLTAKSKTRNPQSRVAQTNTKSTKEQTTSKKKFGNSGMLLRPKENKASSQKQFNVATSSKQISTNKNLQVKKPLDSEISLKQIKKLGSSPKDSMVDANSNTFDKSKLYLKSTKKITRNPTEDIQPELSNHLSENTPEDFRARSKKPVGHSGIVLRQRENKASSLKQLNVATSSKQISRNKNLQDKKPLDSEISPKQNKKLGSSSGDSTVEINSNNSNTIGVSKQNLKPTEKIRSLSEDLPPELCKTLLDNIPEDFLLSPVKNISHGGVKFIPKARKKSLSFNLKIKPEKYLVKSNDSPKDSEISPHNEMKL